MKSKRNIGAEILLTLLSLALLVGLFQSTAWIGIDRYLTLVLTRLSLLFVLGASVTSLLVLGVVRNGTLRKSMQNLGMIAYSAFILFLLLEGAFMFVGRTHGVESSLASRVWMESHWKPINEANYRGRMPTEEEFRTKHLIFMVGDSFTAGYGVKNIEDRFSNVAGSLLPEPFLVMNHGIKGSDLRHAITRIEGNSILPQTLVLQYTVNDIIGVAMSKGQRIDYHPFEGLPGPLVSIIKNSFVINFIYWRLPRSVDAYENFYETAFATEEIRAVHFAEIQRLIDFTQRYQVDLVVLLFPDLVDPERTLYGTEPIAAIFRSQGVPVIEVAELIEDIPVRQRIININDHHPSVLVHERVGRRLYEVLMQRPRGQSPRPGR